MAETNAQTALHPPPTVAPLNDMFIFFLSRMLIYSLTYINILHNIKYSMVFLLTITAAGVVPCGGPKKYPRTSPIFFLVF